MSSPFPQPFARLPTRSVLISRRSMPRAAFSAAARRCHFHAQGKRALFLWLDGAYADDPPRDISKEFWFTVENSDTAFQSSTIHWSDPSAKTPMYSAPPDGGLRSVQNGARTLLGAVALGKFWLTNVLSAACVEPPTIA